MTIRDVALMLGLLALAVPAAAVPTRSSPIAVAADGHVFVVNPDSNSVARLEFNAMHQGTLTHEQGVGRYPRTVAAAGAYVFTADQNDDTVSRRDQADLGNPRQVTLGFGCAPYGVAPTPAGNAIVVTCQGSSEAVILDLELNVVARVELAWPGARAIAIASDGTKAYVTHYLTEEPGADAHVSVVDVNNKSVTQVFSVTPDATTCETQNSGQGPLNLVSAIALVPDGAPADVAGQLWIGGTQQNNVSKGLFKREATFKQDARAGLFQFTFAAFPDGGANRNVYKASFHDITRFGIFKLNAATGEKVGKIDIDEANNATDIEFSADGTTAYVVDLMFNSYHIFNTRRGQGADPTTLFAAVSMNGPGGENAGERCVPDALRPVTSEAPYRLTPQSQISTIEGYNPVDTTFTVVNTGLDFDAPHYWTTGAKRMRPVPDGIGTSPMGVRLSNDGQAVYVTNYLARNVVVVASAQPLDGGGKPANLRCTANAAQTCGTNNDCPAGIGFCNHPGGTPCMTDADCGSLRPCIRSSDCVPLILGPVVSTLTGGIAADPVHPSILDGKNLFNTAARDASLSNGVGLGAAAPLFNNATEPMNQDGGAPVPGAVVSTSHDASYVTCTACHADFGGQDGRTWDFSQFGASLRNTMDLRGRAGFAPGTCSNNAAEECFFDATCGTGNVCRMNPALIPPNVQGADRNRYFNPALTVHWNGDRDEVEDFEHTYRSLLGAGDCDAAEDLSTCQGGLIQRSPLTSSDPRDVNPDLGSPNRNIVGATGKIVGVRLTHMADFVYSLTDFVRNPNPPDAEAELGRQVFNDPQTRCASCHSGGPPGKEFFTDKRPKTQLENPAAPARADANNPFVRHDVGTANAFDRVDPLAIANANGTYQNPRTPIPGSRGTLGEYVTPVLNDLWNTAPYLHDGSAAAVLDVVRPCDTTVDDCFKPGRGRNVDRLHGTTDTLTPQQLNALARFQDTLTTSTAVGSGPANLRVGAMDLRRVVLSFGKTKRAKRGTRARGRFEVSGTFFGAPAPVDPKTGVTLTIATPGGERMQILSRALAMKGKGKSFSGRSTENGAVSLRLKQSGNGYRFTATGKAIDLAALDTGNRDLAVAIEVGGTQFVENRNLVGKKSVFKLPRRKS